MCALSLVHCYACVMMVPWHLLSGRDTNCLWSLIGHQPLSTFSPFRQGSVHAQQPDLCDEVGKFVALELVNKLDDNGEMALEMLFSITIA